MYFVLRSNYEVPSGHRVVEFDDGSVLGWIQKHWADASLRKMAKKGDDDAMHDRTRALVGEGVYGFSGIWRAMAKWGKHPPKSYAELEKFFASVDYPEGDLSAGEHVVQVTTDDDAIELAWYLFDEEFVRAHPERTAYLLHGEWRLPEEHLEAGLELEVESVTEFDTGTRAAGVVYCVFLSACDGMTISELAGCFSFRGVRLPEFGEFLVSQEIPVVESRWDATHLESRWPDELILTRALLRIAPTPDLRELAASADSEPTRTRWSSPRELSDFNFGIKIPQFLGGDAEQCERDFAKLEAHDEGGGRKRRSIWRQELQPLLIQSTPHFCQVRFNRRAHADGHPEIEPTDDLRAYLFFDDLWAAANPLLAESILHYGTGPDCLQNEPAD